MKKLWGLALLLAVGCGSASDISSGSATPTVAREVSLRQGSWSEQLRPGWNSLAFRCTQVTRLTSAAQQLLWWDGRQYVAGEVTAEAVQAAGTTHGFWVYAAEAGALSYEGSNGELGAKAQLRLASGWNLVAVPADVPVALEAVGPALPASGGPGVEGQLSSGVAYWLFSAQEKTVTYPCTWPAPGLPSSPPPPPPPPPPL